MTTKPSFKAVRDELRSMGLRVSRTGWGNGEVRVYFPDAKPGEGHFTEDLADALGTGRAMAAWRMGHQGNAPTTKAMQ